MSEDHGFAAPPTLGRGQPATPSAPAAPTRGSETPFAPAPPAPRRRRRGVLVAWIVGGAALVAIVGGVITDLVLTAQGDSREAVERSHVGSLHSVQAVAGLCLEDVPEAAGDVGGLTSVPCDTPHRAEIIASTKTGALSWPGNDALAAEATEFCAAQVARIVPADLADALRWRAWTPTDRTWAVDDRTLLCVVVASEPLAGSVEAGTASLG